MALHGEVGFGLYGLGLLGLPSSMRQTDSATRFARKLEKAKRAPGVVWEHLGRKGRILVRVDVGADRGWASSFGSLCTYAGVVRGTEGSVNTRGVCAVPAFPTNGSFASLVTSNWLTFLKSSGRYHSTIVAGIAIINEVGIPMAQWKGQYSGHTHVTKILELESCLRKAVAAYHSSGEAGKLKAVEKLADRLLKARVKNLRAWLDLLVDRESGAKLRQQVDSAIASGLAAILREFNCDCQE